jgi:cytochrome c peroxidase
MGPIDPVLARLDPLLARPVSLSDEQFGQLIAFLRNGLLDPQAKPENLGKLVSHSVPSGRPVLVFEFSAAILSANEVQPRLFFPLIRYALQ